MITKDITEHKGRKTNVIVPFKNNIFKVKINKSIEIVIVHNPGEKNFHQDNVGIILEENKILKILSQRYSEVVITKIQHKKDLDRLLKRKPDLVFSGVKYFNFNNDKVWLNDCLEAYGIRYIASSRAALDNESDKNKAKKLIVKANIKTADFFVATPDEHEHSSSIPIPFPLFIKPVKGGDSRGIDSNSVAYNFASFKKKVLEIKTKHNLSSLVETYLPGKEYSVGIFQDSIKGTLRAMPVQIIVKKNINGHRILDFNVKKDDEEKVIAVTDTKYLKKYLN
jgi:D-alanine-D-alanine ligase and related ATP-grasp enzymes